MQRESIGARSITDRKQRWTAADQVKLRRQPKNACMLERRRAHLGATHQYERKGGGVGKKRKATEKNKGGEKRDFGEDN